MHHVVEATVNAICNPKNKDRIGQIRSNYASLKGGEKGRSVTHSVTHFVTHFDKLRPLSPFVTHFEGSKSIKNESKAMIRKNPEIG